MALNFRESLKWFHVGYVLVSVGRNLMSSHAFSQSLLAKPGGLSLPEVGHPSLSSHQRRPAVSWVAGEVIMSLTDATAACLVSPAKLPSIRSKAAGKCRIPLGVTPAVPWELTLP